MRETQCFPLKIMSTATLHFFKKKTVLANFAKYMPNYVPCA